MTRTLPLDAHSSSSLPFKNKGSSPCNGSLWEYRIQDGLSLSCMQIQPEKQVRLEYEKDQPVLNIGFILSGKHVHQINAPGLEGQEMLSDAGTCGIRYTSCQQGALVIPAATPVCLVHVHLSLPFFHELFHADGHAVPKKLQPILKGSVKHSYLFRTGISPRVESVLHRLMTGPCHATPVQLFYHSIALDLILEQITTANNDTRSPQHLTRGEQEQLLHAKTMLIQNLVEPPSMKQLSRASGINVNKLQQGFYQLYGVSVFTFLQQYRMREANRLFHETDMNVTQAAMTVGYSNLSHFSKAYKKYFGILPKKHLQSIRNGNV
ncbi:MAG: hypothetical protein CSA21_05630 [Deltaproteobacteria bacterium]|nr:MAG: hypothetical protein CSA21_05630 [Deltaproteobacteria bacterium]